MSDPVGGGAPDDEPYTGPPPTIRPEPGRWPGPLWQAPVWETPPWYGSPGQVPPRPGPPVQGPPWQAAPWPPGAAPGQQPGHGWPPAAPPADLRWAPPPGTPPHDVPRPFLLAMRARDWAWWRPLLGLLLLSVVYLVAATVVVLITLLTGISPDLGLLDLIDPVTLLVTNLSLIVAVPVVWLAWAAAHGMGTGWSSSVLARLRWRLFLPYTALALMTLGVGIGISTLAGFGLGETEVTGPVRSVGWLLLVVVLTTPLQSAAEEYLFRGYLSQAIAGWVGRERAGAVLAAVLTAALFSAAHAPTDVPTFLDRFAFGLAASAVVWLTGGLEAAIVLHAVNNVLVFVLAGLLGEGVATAEVPSGTGYLYVLLSLLSMGAYVALVARWTPRLRPELRTPAHDLRARQVLPVPAR
jgi:membrane protease YdiL (CAAX protease family)